SRAAARSTAWPASLRGTRSRSLPRSSQAVDVGPAESRRPAQGSFPMAQPLAFALFSQNARTAKTALARRVFGLFTKVRRFLIARLERSRVTSLRAHQIAPLVSGARHAPPPAPGVSRQVRPRHLARVRRPWQER